MIFITISNHQDVPIKKMRHTFSSKNRKENEFPVDNQTPPIRVNHEILHREMIKQIFLEKTQNDPFRSVSPQTIYNSNQTNKKRKSKKRYTYDLNNNSIKTSHNKINRERYSFNQTQIKQRCSIQEQLIPFYKNKQNPYNIKFPSIKGRNPMKTFNRNKKIKFHSKLKTMTFVNKVIPRKSHWIDFNNIFKTN